MEFLPQSPQRSVHPPDLHLHLSKLRKALTCSICHQLLQKPACLHCNHHFCMSCLLRSMEDMSACPKCKQPAATRQARFAPEMDTLTDIYQGLETAAGPIIAHIDDSQAEKIMEVKSTAFNVKVEDKGISPNSLKRLRRYETRGRSNIMADTTEADSREREASVDVPCKGILPASKRIQLPCPPLASDKSEADEVTLDKTNSSNNQPTSDFACVNRVANGSTAGKQGYGIAHATIGGKARALVSHHDDKASLPVEAQVLESHRELRNSSGRVLGKRTLRSQAVAEERTNLNTACESDKQDIATQSEAHEAGHSGRQNGVVLNQANQGNGQVTCAFCHKPKCQVAGPLVHYKEGISVSGNKRSGNVISVHKNCAEWAPGVYFEDDVAKGIPQEVARGQKIKCHVCGLKGAVLGCFVKRCRKSFHFPCAHTLPCRWDKGNFFVFCPEHVQSKFPDEPEESSSKLVNVLDAKHPEDKAKRDLCMDECKLQSNVPMPSVETSTPSKPVELEACLEEKQVKNWDAPKWPASQLLEIEACREGPLNKWSKLVLCSSGLSPKANDLLATFIRYTGLQYEKTWTPSVTHLITGTDEIGAARRTFKYLMATLEGKWIVKVDWLSACMTADRNVSEAPYEVNIDVHGLIGGPRRARGMSIAKVHGLFEGFRFYLMGEYTAAYKADLHALLIAAGGEVLNRMPESAGDTRTCTVIIYSKDMVADTGGCHKEELNKSRCAEAKSLATLIGARVAGHTWILDSVAAYELQPFE